jgi:hypothetical protein
MDYMKYSDFIVGSQWIWKGQLVTVIGYNHSQKLLYINVSHDPVSHTDLKPLHAIHENKS